MLVALELEFHTVYFNIHSSCLRSWVGGLVAVCVREVLMGKQWQ